ncbi:GDSL esterase/lipase At1g71691-like [Miscanthus floridulus]|uniref:GDSL esterase/lipase At1g71691-like n=1 Tax=Miscanthus floridulus TaxID=154761 RepID=UPI00345ACE17
MVMYLLSNPQYCSSEQQVRLFESTKAAMESNVGPRAVSQLLSKSFFLIGVGSNDFFAFATALEKQNKTAATQSDVAAFYSSLISNYSSAITELYKLGARKFGIINVGPVGCVPIVRVLNPTGGCADGLNQLAAGLNGILDSLLAGLAPKLPGLAYSIADSFGFAARTDPLALGFVSQDSACCGGGRLGAEADCLPGAKLCADRDRFLFWDRVHPSQRAAMLSAQAYYDGPAEFTAPINFKQLADKS